MQNAANRAMAGTVEPEGRGMRLFLVHEGFDPGGPARTGPGKIMSGGRTAARRRAQGEVPNGVRLGL
ncbi:hypothetical protein SAMN05444921_12781 [Streptomyces wuyuanensis]|uniref:Uncharacterized protein n=1 Tax=Streptomyces wuyuanensis TaxID=1196353 RepID=A0A1H0BIM7_9ACTN|nr:hypothetical protein SAMN05444921_12781 [Streptomyces wuyuanensis]